MSMTRSYAEAIHREIELVLDGTAYSGLDEHTLELIADDVLDPNAGYTVAVDEETFWAVVVDHYTASVMA